MGKSAGADLAASARRYTEILTGWPSVTGSSDEAAFAGRLAALLADWPIFRDNPADITIVPAPGGAHAGRASVLALVRGNGSRTVLLAGHFDTVPVDDYGELAPLAGEPDKLRNALLSRLEASGENIGALEDLRSSAFVPGRGLLDMKSGLAAGLAVLEAFAGDPGRQGNLLLLACPDEEENSAGMRSVSAMLPAFLDERALDPLLTVNLDATCDNGDGKAGRVVTMGTIGKLLLSALVVGKESHACYPFDGVNAAYLAAELVAEMEYAPELGERGETDGTAPPTALGLKDLKPLYNVTTPARVWAFWNVLHHRRKAADILSAAADVARRAMANARCRAEKRSEAMAVALSDVWRTIPVVTFADLRKAAEERDESFAESFSSFAGSLAGRSELDLPTRSRMLVEFSWERSGLAGPAIVLCIGSMPYPPVEWPAGTADVRSAIEEAIKTTAERHGTTIETRPFFPAISDISFMGPVDAEDLAVTAINTPLWGSSIAWDIEKKATPAIPTINAGPWGRDYHHFLERAHAGYTFGVLPDLVETIVRKVLGAKAG